MANYSEVMKVTDFIFGMQGSFMRVLDHLEFQNHQRSGYRFSFGATNLRLANYSEVMKVTDFFFGMQGSFIRVVDHLACQR